MHCVLLVDFALTYAYGLALSRCMQALFEGKLQLKGQACLLSDCCFCAAGEAVMMGWEAPLMEKHAAAICRGGGGHYLNVGFGLGIVDNEIQVRT